MNAFARFSCISILAIFCAACGGGGSPPPPITPSPPPPITPSPPPPGSGPVATDITLSNIALDQLYQPSLQNYTATTGPLDSTTSVTVILADAETTTTVNGAQVASGTESNKITLNQGSNGITVSVADESGANSTAYTVDVTRRSPENFAQRAYIKVSNTQAFDPDSECNDATEDEEWELNCAGHDNFGNSVALDGDTLVVGAWQEDSSATGVDGDQSDDSALNSGAVYVFTRDASGVWSQQAYIKASNTGKGDLFGRSVSVSGDTLAVGAPEHAWSSGAVYVFTRDSSGVWSQQAYIKASNTDERDVFGGAVALHNNTLAVTAVHEDSNATGINGDQADNSAEYSGAVYVFTRDASGVWNQQAYIKASNAETGDLLGRFVGLDGDLLALGVEDEDSIATGINGDQANNSADDSGAVYFLSRDASGAWSQQAYTKASNTDVRDWFGYSVAMDGNTVVVGAINEDSNATGIEGDQADNSARNAGAVYLFE